VESKRSIFAKTKGVDLKTMIRELRSYGIQVLGSAILFLEHHTRENIQEDIDFVIDLETDFVQFMELGPLPGTALYQQYNEQGRVRHDIPFAEWHGQDKIWFDHPHFSRDETAQYLKNAFLEDYERQGPSLLRLADTSLRGYQTMKIHPSRRLRFMAERLKQRCLQLRPLFPAIRKYAENEKTVAMVDQLMAQYQLEFGTTGLLDHVLSQVVHFFAGREKARIARSGNMRQPPTRYMTYRMKTTGAAETGDNVVKMPVADNVVKSARAFDSSGGEIIKSKSG
jgi:hypothetical protein